MKDKIIRFMRGRYGNDQLSGFLIWTGLIVMVLDAIIKTGILYGLGLVMVIYGYVRVFSKKYSYAIFYGEFAKVEKSFQTEDSYK